MTGRLYPTRNALKKRLASNWSDDPLANVIRLALMIMLMMMAKGILYPRRTTPLKKKIQLKEKDVLYFMIKVFLPR